MISSRNKTNVDRAVGEINELIISRKATGLVCDCSNTKDQKNLIDYTVDTFGGLDILISNAGINASRAPLLNQSEQDWDAVMNVNLKAAFLLTKQAFPHLKKRR